MRVIIDLNVFLSYLLSPAPNGVVVQVVTACFTLDEIELLIPAARRDECATTVASKLYFCQRIPPRMIDQCVAQLTLLAELLPPVEDGTSFSRDPDDDYLVASGIVHEAHSLITADRDLLSLRQVNLMQIVTPNAFLNLLREQHRWPDVT